jgi:molybdopterin/thiamine biosynthesis adenylyltransferase
MRTLLAEKRALVLGAGRLGGPALVVLASAGVGRLVIVDDDVLDTSDLAGQPLFAEADLGATRSSAAVRRLARQFPSTRLEALDGRLDAVRSLELARSADVMLACSADIPTHFLANDSALAAGIPLVHGGVIRYTAQLLTVIPGMTGCLRCLFESPPVPRSIPTSSQAGVLGPFAGLAGALMGAEAVRLLSGESGTYAGQLLVYESRRARSRTIPVRLRKGCAACEAALAAARDREVMRGAL